MTKERIKRLGEEFHIKSEICDSIEELEHIANTVFMLMIKFYMNRDRNLLGRVIGYMNRMRERDRSFILFGGRKFLKLNGCIFYMKAEYNGVDSLISYLPILSWTLR